MKGLERQSAFRGSVTTEHRPQRPICSPLISVIESRGSVIEVTSDQDAVSGPGFAGLSLLLRIESGPVESEAVSSSPRGSSAREGEIMSISVRCIGIVACLATSLLAAISVAQDRPPGDAVRQERVNVFNPVEGRVVVLPAGPCTTRCQRGYRLRARFGGTEESAGRAGNRDSWSGGRYAGRQARPGGCCTLDGGIQRGHVRSGSARRLARSSWPRRTCRGPRIASIGRGGCTKRAYVSTAEKVTKS